MKDRFAAFLVPLLTAIVLLYQVVADLQIAVAREATLVVIGVGLGIAALAGIVAALGPTVVRVGVLAACVIVFIDANFHLSGLFDRLTPANRILVARDEQRITNLYQIKAALEAYLARVGPLPSPGDYGEATGLATFWLGWWDVSASNEDADAGPFLDFLVDDGILPTVPVDPVNAPSSNEDPRGGKQYVYFLVPPDYDYEGGACSPKPDRWIYMLGITDLEYEDQRPPARFTGSGCECLWRDSPDFFQHHFDYITCGEFVATPEERDRAAAARAVRAAAGGGAKPGGID